MYTRTTRPLTPPEGRRLRRAIAAAERRGANALPRFIIAGAFVFGALWGATVLATKQFALPTAFWAATGMIIAAWSAHDERRQRRAKLARLEGALAADRVDEVTVASTEVVELEEIEDLGACWAFQVEPDAIVFVRGQELAATTRFPSTDFSIASVLDGRGELAALAVHVRGERLRPTRVVSVASQRTLRFPEHLEVFRGRLAELETFLAPAVPRRP